MISKKARDLRSIFDIDRRHMRDLEARELLKPVQKAKQGKASYYAEDEVQRLLDMKIYMISGYEIPQLCNIFNDTYNSEEVIAEQIRIYKRRVLMLQFFQKIRRNLKETEEFTDEQYVNTLVAAINTLNSHGLEIYSYEDYYEKYLMMIELIFIFDYLSQKESLLTEYKIKSLNRVYDAYCILKKLFGTKIDHNALIKELIDMFDNPEVEDQDIMELSRTIIKKILCTKNRFIKKMMKNFADPIVENLDSQSGSNARERLFIIYDFVYDYFSDEDTIFFLCKNIFNSIHYLDREALEEGEIKLQERYIKDIYAD